MPTVRQDRHSELSESPTCQPKPFSTAEALAKVVAKVDRQPKLFQPPKLFSTAEALAKVVAKVVAKVEPSEHLNCPFLVSNYKRND